MMRARGFRFVAAPPRLRVEIRMGLARPLRLGPAEAAAARLATVRSPGGCRYLGDPGRPLVCRRTTGSPPRLSAAAPCSRPARATRRALAQSGSGAAGLRA